MNLNYEEFKEKIKEDIKDYSDMCLAKRDFHRMRRRMSLLLKVLHQRSLFWHLDQ